MDALGAAPFGPLSFQAIDLKKINDYFSLFLGLAVRFKKKFCQLLPNIMNIIELAKDKILQIFEKVSNINVFRKTNQSSRSSKELRKIK